MLIKSGMAKVQVTGHSTQVTGQRPQVTGHTVKVKKNTCEFAVSSNLVRIYLFLFLFSLYSLFIPTNPMMSSYFSKIPCFGNNAQVSGV